MLSIAKLSDGQLQYYSAMARLEYYTEGGAKPGVWLRGHDSILDLTSDRVDTKDLEQAFLGNAPDGTPLRQVQQYTDGRKVQRAWDLTFSPPKSVSVFWSLGSDEERAEIEGAHHRALSKVVAHLEFTGALTRTGASGEKLERGKLLAAAFEHGTSRAQDPQLHTHVLLMNVVLHHDGKTRALHSSPIYKRSMELRGLYRTELASNLKELGYGLRQGRTSFELAAVPEELSKHFSTQRALIEKEAARLGFDSPKLLQQLAIQVRSPKEHVPMEALRVEWKRQAQELGLGLGQKHGPSLEPPFGEAFIEATEELTLLRQAFSRSELTGKFAAALEASGAPMERVLEELERYVKQEELLEVNETMLTTKEAMAREKRMELLFESLSGLSRWSPIQSDARAKRHDLTAPQARGLKHLLEESGGVALLDSPSRHDRMEALKAAVLEWKKRGHRVVVVAPGSEAALALKDELRAHEGTSSFWLLAKTDTSLPALGRHLKRQAARLLEGKSTHAFNPDVLKRKTVLVVEGASKLTYPELEGLGKLSQRYGSKLVLSGSSRGLFVNAGHVYTRLRTQSFAERMASSIGRVSRNLLRARAELSRGHVQDAATRLAASGSLVSTPTEMLARTKLVDSFARATPSELKDRIAVVGTLGEKDELNDAISKARAKELKLRGITARLEDTQLVRGDRVSFRWGVKSQGVLEGETGTVSVLWREGLGLKPPMARIVLDKPNSLGLKRVVVMPVERKGPLELAYANTVREAQGLAVRHVASIVGELSASELDSRLKLAVDRVKLFAPEAVLGEDLGPDSSSLTLPSHSPSVSQGWEPDQRQRMGLGL